MLNSPSPVELTHFGAVAVITIASPPVNALSRAVRLGLMKALQQVTDDRSILALVISGGPGRFIAGADIREMDLPPDEPFLPDVIAAIDALAIPVIAAIDGPALGGGLEVALACDYRLASPKAAVGLPEVNLGIIPGSGGTQRLPRLTGVAEAIRLIGGARIVKAAEALSLGIIDAIDSGDLIAAAIAMAPSLTKRLISELPVPEEDAEAERKASAAVLTKAKGVPALLEVPGIIIASRNGSFADGLRLEREAFLRLRQSPEAAALRHVFKAEREASKLPEGNNATPRPIATTAVIGGGTMGAGIAMALATGGLPVTVIERDAASVSTATARLEGLVEKQVSGGRLSADDGKKRLALMTVTEDWNSLAQVDLVIEAAFEDMAVKTDIFRRLDAVAKPGAILATNTSYLDIDAIAAATKRPGDVLGLHFFSPAHVMKLLEVVHGAATAPDVLATAMALGKKLGKLSVISGNCDGFIGNRIYATYRRHAEYLVEDGATPEQVDRALEAYGFAMGVFSVSDMSGLDISYAMRKRRAATRDPAERYSEIADRLVESGRLGRKTGSGWYRYDASGKKETDPEVQAVIEQIRQEKAIVPRDFSDAEIQSIILSVMADEGSKVLAEGIAQRAFDIDVVFINGYGFPRHKGGPMWAAGKS